MDVNPTDRRVVADMQLAARGDGQAQLRLARAARELVLAGDADEIIASVEGVTYARLASAQGIPDAYMLLAEHCAHLAAVYAQCGEQATSDMWLGQAIAILELAAERLPDENAAALMSTLNLAADSANPQAMREAKLFHAIFAPAFGAAAFA